MSNDTDFEKLMKSLAQSQQSNAGNPDKFEAERKRVLDEIDHAMKRSATAAELSSKIAKDMKKSFADRLPSVKDIMGSVISANPALSAMRNVANVFSPGDVGSGANEDRNRELQAMRDQVSGIQALVDKPDPIIEFEPSDSVQPVVVDEILTTNNRQLEVMMDLYEVWSGVSHILSDQLKYEKKLAEFAAEADREDDRSDLQGQAEASSIPGYKPSGLAERAEEEKSIMENSLDDMIGSVFGNAVGPMLGRVGKVVGKLKGAFRFLGPIAAIATTLYAFYEGFSDPQAVLGRATEGIGDNIQAGIVNIFTSVAELADWIVGFVGIDINMEGFVKEKAIEYTDILRGLFGQIPEIASSIYDGIVNSFDNMKAQAMAKANSAFEAAGGARDYLGAMITGLVDGIADWMVELLSSMKDLPVVGGFVQDAIDKINSMRETKDADLVGSGSGREDTAKKIVKGTAEQKAEEQRRKQEYDANQEKALTAVHNNTSQQTNVNTTNYNSTSLNVHNDEPTRQQNRLATQRTY